MRALCQTFLLLYALFLVPLSFARSDAVALVKRDAGPTTVYTPPPTYVFDRVLYARHVLLPDAKGTLLATFETYPPSGTLPTFPIYRSKDQGLTWSPLSSVEDVKNGWGLTSQPFLYVLQQEHGDFRAGTVLCTGVSISADNSLMKIELYASNDTASTWTFVSTVTQETPINNARAVWTPFLFELTDSLLVYYSITHDTKEGQKIVHRSSRDLRTWSASVDDALATLHQNGKVGMATVASLPNGQYIMTYEYVDAPEGKYSVYYKIAANPKKFIAAEAMILRATDGTTIAQSPYVIWTLAQGLNGAIVVSCGTTKDLLVNTALGDPDRWTRVGVPTSAGSWARGLAVGYLYGEVTIIDGGFIGQKAKNVVTFSVVDLTL